MHSTDPITDWYCPAPQLTHVLAVAENVPAGHTVHVADPETLEELPVEQIIHIEALAPE